MSLDLTTLQNGQIRNAPQTGEQNSVRRNPERQQTAERQAPRSSRERPLRSHAAEMRSQRRAPQQSQRRSTDEGSHKSAAIKEEGASPTPTGPLLTLPFDHLLKQEQVATIDLDADENAVLLNLEQESLPLIIEDGSDTDSEQENELELTLLLPAALDKDQVHELRVDLAPLQEEHAPKALEEGRDDADLLVSAVLGPAADIESATAPRIEAGEESIIPVQVGDVVVPVSLSVAPVENTGEETVTTPVVAEESKALAHTVLSEDDGLVQEKDPGVNSDLAAMTVNEGERPMQGSLSATELAMASQHRRDSVAVETLQAPAAVDEVEILGQEDETPSTAMSQQGLNTGNRGQVDIRSFESLQSSLSTSQSRLDEAEQAVQHQVKRAIVQQMANGDRSLSLRLTPPHLGTVRIELIESRGVMTVRFHAEDDAVRQSLERQLPQLRQDLRAADAPVASLSLEEQARGWQQGQPQGQAWQQQTGQDGQQQQQNFSLNEEDYAKDPSTSTNSPTTATLGGRVEEDLVDARA